MLGSRYLPTHIFVGLKILVGFEIPRLALVGFKISRFVVVGFELPRFVFVGFQIPRCVLVHLKFQGLYRKYRRWTLCEAE